MTTATANSDFWNDITGAVTGVAGITTASTGSIGVQITSAPTLFDPTETFSDHAQSWMSLHVASLATVLLTVVATTTA